MHLAYPEIEKITPFYNGPFSNWHPSKFNIDNIEFNCNEQFMMFTKALFFKDEATAKLIMETTSPREQKKLGRQVRNFSKAKWDAAARHYIFIGCLNKFQQNEDLLAELEKTKDTLLVEASPTDYIWGVGLAKDDPNVYDKSKWQGTNWLGEILTDTRISIFGE